MTIGIRAAAIALIGTGQVVVAQDAEPYLASNFTMSARVDAGIRHYFDDGLYVGQSSAGSYPFFGLQLTGSGDLGAGRVAFDLSGLVDNENGRTYGNIGELYYYQSFGDADVLFGFDTENWSVVESRSIINVINPRNLADSPLQDELLGTPMVTGNYYSNVGTFTAHALVGFIEPNLGDERSRFRAPILPDYNNPVFEEGDGRHFDIALRYTTNFNLGDGAVDLSVNYFNGTNRTPVCTADGVTASSCNDAVLAAMPPLPGAPGPGASNDEFWAWMEANATDALVSGASAVTVPGLRPLYQHIQQVGATLVYSRNDLQLRFEGFYRETKTHNMFASVVGGDYTWHDITPSGGSLSVALEYLYDNRDPEMGVSIFEDDVFLGVSYNFNNRLDTRANFGVFHDLSSQAQLYSLGVYSRINDNLGVTLNATKVHVTGWNDPLAYAKNDSFLELYLSAFF